MNKIRRNYTGIEIFRVFFAMLIPLLHIPISGNYFQIIRQYISRLGVPFFFTTSGMFLSYSIQRGNKIVILKKYCYNIGKLLIVWLIIYLPAIISTGNFSIQTLLFRTPAYLWYLTALFFAIFPFCLISNRRFLFILSIIFYIIGAILSESYAWLGVGERYRKIFLTSRNGIFFALPLMCIGELSWKIKKSWLNLLFSTFLLIFEITFIGKKVSSAADRSFYLMIPLFMVYFISMIRSWNPEIYVNYCKYISSGIYLMQYGIIFVGNRILSQIRFGRFQNLIVYSLVIIIPTVFYFIFCNKNIIKLFL